MSVAETIAQQIGGINRLRAMIGAHTFIDHSGALSFKFKGSPYFNYVKITLATSDTYVVYLARVDRRGNRKSEDTVEGLLCEQLQAVIESKTQLRLSL